MMNFYRNLYLTEEHPDDKKIDWWQMIQLLPSSYNQKRTVMLSYEVLAGIYPMRRNHKLDEWSEHEPDLVIRQGDDVHYMYPYHGFCDWIKTLPYSELITGSESLKIEKLGQEFVKGFEDGINKTLKVISKNKTNSVPSVIHDSEHVEEREDSNE